MISGILLAAGNSSRMGDENKLLLPYEGKPLFMNAVDALLNSSLDEVVVIVGHEAEKLLPYITDENIKIGMNKNYLDGQTSSIKIGLEKVNINSQAILICLADMPYLKEDHIDALIQMFKSIGNSKSILRPFDGYNPGNPIIFSRCYYDELSSCEDPNGCKSIVMRHRKNLEYFHTESQAYFKDIDTKEEYRNI